MTYSRSIIAVAALALLLGVTWHMRRYAARGVDPHFVDAPAPRPEPPDAPLKDIEEKLRPLAEPKRTPGPHDWLANHFEGGQTFADYRNAGPVGIEGERKVIRIVLIGDFSAGQRAILEKTREYVRLFFGVPVEIEKTIPTAELPESAWRTHPEWVTRQLLTGHVLTNILEANRPKDALAYIAFTASDLTPGAGWNFVFGQANLQERVGVWSIHRLGDPELGPDEERLCLRRTLGVASHEMGHILTIEHCTAFECNMNGSNSLEESDRQPMHYCPVCTRKLCWDLKLDSVARFRGLASFYRANGIDDEAHWSEKAVNWLESPP